MIKDDVITYLTNQSTVTDIVSTRIRPNQAVKSDTRPFIYVEADEDVPEYHAGGESGKARSFVRIFCEEESWAEAATLADTVRKVVSGFSGTMGSTSVSYFFVTDIRDNTQPPRSGETRLKPSKVIHCELFHALSSASV